jgi:hypothetical protein
MHIIYICTLTYETVDIHDESPILILGVATTLATWPDL